jgi:raffinose/stachyose/melibiose transport system permease protein
MTATSEPLSQRRIRSGGAIAVGRVAAGLGKYASLIAFSLILLLPLVVIVFASLKSAREYLTTSALTPPKDWFNFANFGTAWVGGDMLQGFANTALILSVSIVITVLLGTMAAYALDRFDFRFKKVVFALFLIATLVPSVTTQVATYQVINGLGLVDTYPGAILLFSGTDIVSVYIFVQFMQSIPKSLDEAAMLEGVSRFGVYWRIILPLLQPAIATVVIIKGIAIYNEFYIPLLYLPSPEHNVISTALFKFIGPYSASQQVIAAGVLIVIIPTLAIFILLQRFIYNGITRGATK